MTETWLVVLTFGAALGCGLTAGVFFAFSSFVMNALARLPAPQGIAAMQSINVVAVTPLFMTALFGTAAACFVLAVSAWYLGQQPGARYLIAGSVCYVVGVVFVTMVFNVPANNRLADVTPAAADAAGVWREYRRGWTAWNHVRTISALIAAALITAALRQQ